MFVNLSYPTKMLAGCCCLCVCVCFCHGVMKVVEAAQNGSFAVFTEVMLVVALLVLGAMSGCMLYLS